MPVPKNIPLKEATIAKGEDENEVMLQNTTQSEVMIGVEKAPLQQIQLHDFRKVDNEIYQRLVKEGERGLAEVETQLMG